MNIGGRAKIAPGLKCRVVAAGLLALAFSALAGATEGCGGPAPERARPSSPPPEAGDADRWYVIKIAGSPAGTIHEQVETKPATMAKADPAGEADTAPPPRLLVTTSEMRLVLNRLGSRIELRFLSSAEESAPDGLLLRTSHVMLASNQSTKSDAVVGDGQIEVRSEAGGKAYTNTLTFTGPLFGPEAVRRACAEGLKKPGDAVTIQTFIPEASLVGDLTRVVLGLESVTIEGRPVPPLRSRRLSRACRSSAPAGSTSRGTCLNKRSPGLSARWRWPGCQRPRPWPRRPARSFLPRSIERSIVRTNIRLPRSAPLDRLRLKLSHRSPALGWPDLASGNQKVLEKTEKELTLEIRRPAEPKGMTYPVPVNAENREFLEPNAYIQSDDAEIRGLAGELAGKEQDAFRAALAMERWTAEQMTFDLGIVFAPATEVFRDRRGTCVGYATLLATLARAAGIPSRVAMGYVYAQGMFGGHAWTEILAGNEWIPLDAAIVNEGVADAAHLAIITSSLAGGPGEMSLGAAQQIFGQVDIPFWNTSRPENRRRCPRTPSHSRSRETAIVNPWLGVEMTKPGDYCFAKLDAVWPDPTIVGMSGPHGEKAALEEQPVFPWQEMPKVAVERLAKTVPGAKRGMTIGEGPGAEKRVTPDNKGSAEMGINRTEEVEAQISMKLMEKQVPAIYSADGKTAAAAFGRGAALFVLKVEGPAPPALLRRLAADIRLD